MTDAEIQMERDEHFDSRNHWCIVTYVGHAPFYYMGWYGGAGSENCIRPAISIDFNQALKMHSRIAAEQVLNGMRSCGDVGEGWKVEDHAWFGTEAEREGRADAKAEG